MGAVFALFAGFYYWTPKIVGRSFSDLLGKIHFWTLFIGVRQTEDFLKRQKDCIIRQGKVLHLYLSSIAALKKQPEEFIHYFHNVKESKKDIYKNLRKKAGVYVFINNINNKIYVGSSVNLTSRMANYYYYYNSDKLSKIFIIRAMKKYGLENFSLGIMVFCDKNPKTCLDLEQKWIDYLKPDYNVLTIAGNSSNYKHNIETINKLKLIFFLLLYFSNKKEKTKEKRKSS